MAAARWALLLCLVLSAGSVRGESVIAPASERFAQPAVAEEPSLQRHVLPLMSRLGCNGRACHGSFQGQGGFRLSLFGYDFAADHAALTEGETPRVDLRDVRQSLILQKPTMTVDHGGGERFAVDSWQYRLLQRWIESGARPTPEDGLQFDELQIEPRELIFAQPGEARQLRVVARWSDGTSEDVTPLCRYTTDDESIASVDESGRITSRGAGDTHVVVFYDNGVQPVPVMLPLSDRVGPKYPAVATPTKIDELVVEKLRKLGVVPSELCNDEEFLRRVSLDMTGSLPAPDEIVAFLADGSSDKRARKIDELLERPTYAAWWAAKLTDWMGASGRTGPQGGEQALNNQTAGQWYDWTLRRVAENEPYDKLVARVVLAVSRSRPDQTFDEYCQEMSSYFRTENPADFAARETMPYYWQRRNVGNQDAKGLAFAYSFLGVRLECAQCHKHPFDQWTKQDFDQFTAFFKSVSYRLTDRKTTDAMKKELGLLELDEDSGNYKRQFAGAVASGKIAPFKEVIVPPSWRGLDIAKRRAQQEKKSGRVITPRLLGGEEVMTYEYDDPRQPLMDWLTQADNPYFARAIVNRVWANYFNVGIVEPPDDMNLANAPSNAPLLAYLAEQFVAHGYDLKWLHREITNSRTYQLSLEANATNLHDVQNFSHSVARRLPGEVVFDAISFATATDDQRSLMTADAKTVRGRGIGVATCQGGGRNTDETQYAFRLFGKPLRLVNCDCERSNEPTLLQTMYLQNDRYVFKRMDTRDGWIAQQAKSGLNADGHWTDPAGVVDSVYLRTLGRSPTAEERTIAVEHLQSAGDTTSGLRDLMWALLNTKEFVLNF